MRSGQLAKQTKEREFGVLLRETSAICDAGMEIDAICGLNS
jgi:hypothetical protein